MLTIEQGDSLNRNTGTDPERTNRGHHGQVSQQNMANPEYSDMWPSWPDSRPTYLKVTYVILTDTNEILAVSEYCSPTSCFSACSCSSFTPPSFECIGQAAFSVIVPRALHSTMSQEVHTGPPKFLQNYRAEMAFTLLLSTVFFLCEGDSPRPPH